MVNLIRDFLIPVRLFGRGKHVKSYRDKAIAIRAAEGEHSPPFLVIMSYVVIDPCQKFHSLAPILGNDRIIQNQHFDQLWPGQGTENSGYFSSKV